MEEITEGDMSVSGERVLVEGERESGLAEGERWKSGIETEREQICEQRRGRDCENYQIIHST